jgi:hypothetical protein
MIKPQGVSDSFLSHGESDLDNKLGDPCEEDCHQGQLSENSSSFKASDSGFKEDFEVFFGGAIGSFGAGSERSEFFVAWGSPDDFSDESGMLCDGHMFKEAVVVDEEGTSLGILFEFFVLRCLRTGKVAL